MNTAKQIPDIGDVRDSMVESKSQQLCLSRQPL